MCFIMEINNDNEICRCVSFKRIKCLLEININKVVVYDLY